MQAEIISGPQLRYTSHTKMSDISDVDAFDQQQEKLLLEQSMRGDRRRHYDHMEMSDEEVMGFKPSDSEDEEDDDDEILDREEEDDGEAQEAWGKGELYGADEIEDEEDRKLEAEEALKLQKKQAKQMKESDFLGEWAADDSDDEDEEDADLATAGKGVRESIPVKPIESMSSKEQYDQLVRLNPELVLMNAELAKVTEEMAALNKAEEDEDDEPEIVEIKKTALRTYIGVLNAYFALFMDSVKNGKANMKDHIIMEAILKAREMWRMAQEIGLPEEEVDEMASDEEMVSEGAELMDASAAESDVSDDLDLSRFRRRPEDDFEDVEEVEEEVDSDDELALPTSFKAKKSKSKISAVPDYGEHAINDVDQADKDRRKRDLRFYTAKIDKQARGREQEEIEGDADLPYQDRWYERQQQLKENRPPTSRTRESMISTTLETREDLLMTTRKCPPRRALVEMMTKMWMSLLLPSRPRSSSERRSEKPCMRSTSTPRRARLTWKSWTTTESEPSITRFSKTRVSRHTERRRIETRESRSESSTRRPRRSLPVPGPSTSSLLVPTLVRRPVSRRTWLDLPSSGSNIDACCNRGFGFELRL